MSLTPSLLFLPSLLLPITVFLLTLLYTRAFLTPLSRIPGPFYARFTSLPYRILCVKGTSNAAVTRWVERYGNVVRVAPDVVLFAGKEGVRKVLVEEDLEKARIYESYRRRWDVTSLWTERNKDLYKIKRRFLSSGFSISYLNALETPMQSCIHDLVTFLNASCSLSPTGITKVDMSRIMQNLAFDVMSATSFGGSSNLISQDDHNVKEIFLSTLKDAVLDSHFPWWKYVTRYLLLGWKGGRSTAFPNMITAVMKRRLGELELEEGKGKGEVKRDLLQMLIETYQANPETYTEDHVGDDLAIFMIAGSDTTSSSLTHILLLFVNHPEKLELLRKEVFEVFPGLEDEVTFEKTRDMRYLDAVLMEGMRCMPVVLTGLSRHTSERTVIGGYEIPARTVTIAALNAVMHNPKVWPSPHSFIPERWLPDASSTDSQTTSEVPKLSPSSIAPADKSGFFSFSAGRHSCIGQQFAMREMRLVIATLVRRYELSLVEGQSEEQIDHIVPFFVQGGYWVGVRKREQ